MGGDMCGDRGHMGNLPFFEFFSESKTALKNKYFFLKNWVRCKIFVGISNEQVEELVLS